MKNYSIWKEDINKITYPKVEKNINVDILIIGGGITGISTLYHLKDSGLKVALVEKNKIGMGVSSGTTGKLTFLQDLMLSKLENYHSYEIAKKYLRSQINAIYLVKSIIEKNNIECDLTKQTSYLFASKQDEINKIKYEKELLEKMGCKVKEELPSSVSSKYAIKVEDTYYFHPLKYIYELSKLCKNIYEYSNVTELIKIKEGYKCICNNHEILANKVILTCHYPFFIKPFFFPIKGHLERSYLSASKTSNIKNESGINTLTSSTSYRYHDNYFIYLRNSHNIAFKYDVNKNFNNLLEELKILNLYPDYLWTNKDIITNDYLPYIGYIDDNLLIGTGYNTWGMTNGSLAGKVLSDLVLGKENEYQELFDPKRITASTDLISISTDIFSSAKPYIDTKINKNKSFYSDNVLFTKKDGKNIAIYIDEFNKKHIVYNTCPHLKCSLIFNEIEKTWDCPCHASRFDIDGKCIEGPSSFDITYKY